MNPPPNSPASPQPPAGGEANSPHFGDRMRAALQRELGAPEGPRAEAWPGAEPGARPIPPPIPDHRLLHPIGHGAYGEVWLARNALGTLRAVKVVYRARFKDDRPYEREFHGILKYEPISRSHAGLVQVLHVGRNDSAGCFYYVMELADDANAVAATEVDPATYRPRSLRSDLAVRPRLAPAEAAQLALRIADALGQLHAQGLIHRDIKPANVIFVGGQPKLADIGLVTDAGSSQSFVGTEGFIPPEGPGTPQADLFGLGKLLYELATGLDRMDFPRLPPGLAAFDPRRSKGDRTRDAGAEAEALLELNEVLTRACAPDPRQRYGSANELQADLNLFLAGRSLRRSRHTERALARLRRVAIVSTLCLVVAAIAVWTARREERRAADQARAERDLRQRAEQAEQSAQQQLYAALLEQARAVVRSGEHGHRLRALDALRRAAALTNAPELRREVFAALALPDLRLEHEWARPAGVTLEVPDPTFQRLATSRDGGPIEIRTLPPPNPSQPSTSTSTSAGSGPGPGPGPLLATLDAATNRPTHDARWSRDGRYLSAKRDLDATQRTTAVEVWDVAGARRVLWLPFVPWGARDFSPDGAQFIAGRPSGPAAVWDLGTGRETRQVPLPGEPIQLAWSPRGGQIATVHAFGQGWNVAVLDAASGAPIASRYFGAFPAQIRWHPGGEWLAVVDLSGLVHRLDAATGEAHELGQHKAEAVHAVFSPDGRYLLTGGWERELVCWNAESGRREFTLAVDGYRAELSADGSRCAIRTVSGVRLYAFERPTGHREMTGLGRRIRHAAFAPDGHWLAASSESSVSVWDLTSTGPGAFDPAGRETRLSFTPDSRTLIASRNSATHGEGLRYQPEPAKEPGRSPGLRRSPFPSPKDLNSISTWSNQLVVTTTRGTRVLPLDNAAPLQGNGTNGWTPTTSGINTISPDGRWLGIYRPYAITLSLYQLPGLESIARLPSSASIAAAGFSPDGQTLALGSSRGLELWHWRGAPGSWTRGRFLPQFSDGQFTPDGRGLWLAREFRTAGLHDASTLSPLLPLPTGMRPLAQSADGRLLAVTVDAHRLQVWDLAVLRAELRRLGLDWAAETAGPNSD